METYLGNGVRVRDQQPLPGPTQSTRHPESPDAIAERLWITALLRDRYKAAIRRGDRETAKELADIGERVKHG